MSVVVEELRQNNPDITAISIELRNETSDAALAQALEQNPFVTDILLEFEGMQQTDWDSLLRVIATRANLERVELQDGNYWGGNYWVERGDAPTALVRSILRAIQQNTAIRRVGFCGARLPTNISTFVDTASSITSFRLFMCVMEPTEREQGARDLAAALQCNTNIECLEISKLDDIYTVPVLEGLGINTSVKTFIFSPMESFSSAVSHALQELLASTTSIQRFELQLSLFYGDTFRPIAQAITSSECVFELKISLSTFEDQSSITEFRSIVQNKRNLTSLCLHHCSFGREQVHGDIISLFLRPDSLLRCFEFESCRVWDTVEDVFPGIQFQNLLQAIQKSSWNELRLETFRLSSSCRP